MHSTHAEEHADAVVVGSGFGGSVSAYRLADAGQSVVVLERGKPYPPGSFPRNPRQMSRAFWDPSEGLQGMFDVWTFRGFDSVVSSGLGGGSLIYANVLIRKDEKWFVTEDPLPGGGYEKWPVGYADLEPHYEAVERMLRPNPFPYDAPAFASTEKTSAIREAAQRLELDFDFPRLAVSFAPKPGAEPGLGLPIVDPEYGNLHGVPRMTCRLCGECNIGCNEGSKNTLDHTYLSAAQTRGADIRPRSEVRFIRPLDGGGYRVGYFEHLPENEGGDIDLDDLPTRWITCKRLILAAGTYGTSLLLLRNREFLRALSPALGTRFSGNGDLLTFLLPKEDGRTPRPFGASKGPVITGTIRIPDAADGADGRGFYIQDGGYPAFAEWVAGSASTGKNLRKIGAFVGKWLLTTFGMRDDNNFGAEFSELFQEGAFSGGSLPLLGMGRDVPDGVMSLRGNRLHIDWTTETSMEYFERMRGVMRQIADTLDVRYLDNPVWFFRKVITVHPLGGAPIGEHPAEAVCDPYGEVYGHPGLFVADGAAMPGPVGSNPSLTIAAMADRLATHLLSA